MTWYSTIDRRLFPAIYTTGDAYFTVSDGQVWRWIYVPSPLFGEKPKPPQWYRRKIAKLPASARYAVQAPRELQAAVQAKGGQLHRYDLHRGQEHLSEELG